MANYLRQSELAADAASLKVLLNSLPQEDMLGRLGLQSRLKEVVAEMATLDGHSENLASTALYFGGKPVVGSLGIEANFAATAISDFKDLTVKVWATSETQVAARGPVPNQDDARIHVTALLHGSIGFLLEELDVKGTPLFPTPLKLASEEAVRLIGSMVTSSEDVFQEELEKLHPRVFAAVQRFFKNIHRAEASVRMVDANRDQEISRAGVDKAFVRLEESSLEEDPIEEFGLLLGIIPNAGRFEFRSQAGDYREGKVAATLSEAFLRKIEQEQGIGKWFRARMNRKEVKRYGNTTIKYTLTDLAEANETGAPDLLRPLGS